MTFNYLYVNLGSNISSFTDSSVEKHVETCSGAPTPDISGYWVPGLTYVTQEG